MNTNYFFEETSFRIYNTSVLNPWIEDIADLYKQRFGNINIIFTNNHYLLSINKEYLCKDYLTDIITFDYSDQGCISGELFISVDMVKYNSIEYKISFQNELLRVIAHGLLHLFGFKDGTDSEQKNMRKEENECLKYFSNELFVSGI